MATRRCLRCVGPPKNRIFLNPLRHHRRSSNLSKLFRSYDETNKCNGNVSDIIMDVSAVQNVERELELYPRRLPHNAKPLDAFRGGKRLYVTDISTKYCELKFFYESALFAGTVPSAFTEKGTQIHKALEVVSDTSHGIAPVSVSPEITLNEADELWIKFYHNTLRLQALAENRRSVREIYVFGKLSGVPVSGYIDELAFNASKNEVIINDTKSRHSAKIPEYRDRLTAYHQVLVYYRLLSEMLHMSADQLYTLVSEMFPSVVDLPLSVEFVASLDSSGSAIATNNSTPRAQLAAMAETLARVRSVCTLSKDLSVTYVRGAGSSNPKVLQTLDYQFDKATLDQLLEFSLEFWLGKRDAIGVSMEERAKCRSCAMFSHCEWGQVVHKAAGG